MESLAKLGSPAADVAPLDAPIRHRLTAKTWIPSDSSPPAISSQKAITRKKTANKKKRKFPSEKETTCPPTGFPVGLGKFNYLGDFIGRTMQDLTETDMDHLVMGLAANGQWISHSTLVVRVGTA